MVVHQTGKESQQLDEQKCRALALERQNETLQKKIDELSVRTQTAPGLIEALSGVSQSTQTRHVFASSSSQWSIIRGL